MTLQSVSIDVVEMAQSIIGLWIKPGNRVFEYGSGGSTLYFAQKGVEVVSVEHKEDWRKQVLKALKDRGLVTPQVVLARPTRKKTERFAPGDPDLFQTGHGYKGKSNNMWFEDYVKVIDRFPDKHFHLVFVDGRSRPACLKRAICKVRPGGILVLDNSERRRYAFAMKLVPWGSANCWGTSSIKSDPWQTSIWVRPK